MLRVAARRFAKGSLASSAALLAGARLPAGGSTNGLVLGAAIALAVGSAGASAQSTPSAAIDRSRLPVELSQLTDEEVGRIARMSPVAPLPADPTNRFADDERAAELGHELFFDSRLSPKSVSCATCHDPARHFTDGKPLAEGIGAARRNAPTVVDAARRRWIGWDGKFDSLWSQALSPIENPVEMGSSRSALVSLVRDDAALRDRYAQLFGELPAAEATGMELDRATANILKSLGAYQRRLVSAQTPVDRFVSALKGEPGGDPAALDASARRGLAIFVSRGGCYQCHRGPNFTDEEFHNLGFVGANGRTADDPARLAAVDFVQANPFNAAGVFSDAADSPKGQMVRALRRSGELFGQFRTPALRGVALTAPYMHDGRLPTLADVVRFYDTLEGSAPVGHHGEDVLVPLGLGEQGRSDLEAFLRTLTPAASDPRWTSAPRRGSGGADKAEPKAK